MAKTPAKTAPKADATPTRLPAAKADATTDGSERPMAKRLGEALVKPDPDAVNEEPATTRAEKNSTKEQFAAADAVAARSISGL